jgi:hypothetical protein
MLFTTASMEEESSHASKEGIDMKEDFKAGATQESEDSSCKEEAK